MASANQEEADSRWSLHILDAILEDCKIIVMQTVDTNGFVILMGIFFKLFSKPSELELSLLFNSNKNSINKFYLELRKENPKRSLFIIHSLGLIHLSFLEKEKN